MWQILPTTFFPSMRVEVHFGNAHLLPDIANSRLIVVVVGPVKPFIAALPLLTHRLRVRFALTPGFLKGVVQAYNFRQVGLWEAIAFHAQKGFSMAWKLGATTSQSTSVT